MKTADSYHHGSLRAALLRLGLEAIESGGAEALSLRSIADKAGVSKAAPYRHFRDRNDFLAALADEGFRLLGEALSTALGDATALEGMGRAYMAFAVAHPHLYRLMHSPVLSCGTETSMHEARRTMEILWAGLSAKSGASLPEDEEGRRAFSNQAAATWGSIHGLVMLRIDSLFPPYLPEPDWDFLAGCDWMGS